MPAVPRASEPLRWEGGVGEEGEREEEEEDSGGSFVVQGMGWEEADVRQQGEDEKWEGGSITTLRF